MHGGATEDWRGDDRNRWPPILARQWRATADGAARTGLIRRPDAAAAEHYCLPTCCHHVIPETWCPTFVSQEVARPARMRPTERVCTCFWPHDAALACSSAVSVRQQQDPCFRPCLVSTESSKIPVTSNIWTHTWSIKYRLIQNQLHRWRLISVTNFLTIINLSLAHAYCSTTMSNHGLIRLKRFVSQINRKLCN